MRVITAILAAIGAVTIAVGLTVFLAGLLTSMGSRRRHQIVAMLIQRSKNSVATMQRNRLLMRLTWF